MMNRSIAVKGMAWAGGAVIIGRVFGLFAQILMGILLPVEVFAVFALVLLLASLLGGFQDSGVAKVLIGRHKDFRSLVQEYMSFAFWFAVVGASLLSLLGLLMASTSHEKYDGLVGAVAITALSMPVVAIISVHMAALSLDHQFKFLSVVDMARMAFYYALIVILAVGGLGPYVIAVGTLTGAVLQLWILSRRTLGDVPRPGRIHIRRAAALLLQNRWALGASFLVALAVRGDYLVLSYLLTPRELGYYHFGFMLLAQVMVVLSAAIAQVLTPVFAKMSEDLKLLRSRFVMGASGITHLAGLISLCVVILAPAIIHSLWNGKWDGATIVVTTVALTLPYRMSGMVGIAMLEAVGAWRRRFTLLAIDACLLFPLAAVGVIYWGMTGAAVLVAVQRCLSGLLGFAAACGSLDMSGRAVFAASVRAMLPYSVVGVFLSWQLSLGGDPSTSAGLSLSSLVVATSLLVVAIALFDRGSLHVIRTHARGLGRR